MSGLAAVSWKGWAALATFAIQNGAAVLIMRYSKLHSTPYSSQVAVLLQEVALKLPVCMLLYAWECKGVVQAVANIATDLRERPKEWAQLAVPALLYTVQNTMMYVGYANVEAAVGQITYQSKILWTALFSVMILGKKLSMNQWLSLVVLALGVVAVQGMESKPKPHAGHAKRHRHAGPEQSPLLGVGALVTAALCTSFASVYFERMLKGVSSEGPKRESPSLWLRNIQLALYCTVIAAAGIQFFGDESISRLGWFHGFDSFSTWLCIAWQAMGGILVAVTIKYADNILRGFAQGLALIIGAIGSYFLFAFPITPLFTLGAALVMLASFMYGSSAQTPQELCEMLCGQCPSCSTAVAPAQTDDAVEEDRDSGHSTSKLLDHANGEESE